MYKNEVREISRESRAQVSGRRSNLELLRIICMIFIIAHHFSVHSHFEFAADAITFNRVWVQFLYTGGKVGVDVFVLITGYFLIQEASFKFGKLMKLWLQIFTFSAVLFVIFTLTGEAEFSFAELAHNLLPVTFSRWWFASAYFVLLVLAPFFSRMLHAMNKREYTLFLVICTLFWCISQTFIFEKTFFFANYEYNSIVWFLYLYALAGYLRLHVDTSKLQPAMGILLAAAIWIVTFVSVPIFDAIGKTDAFYAENATYLFEMQTLPVLAISVLLFVSFLNIDIGCNKIVNFLSSLTFGIYLLHDSKLFRAFLFLKFLRPADNADSPRLLPLSLIMIPAIFIFGGIVEMLRSRLLEPLYIPAINRFSDCLTETVRKYTRRRKPKAKC